MVPAAQAAARRFGTSDPSIFRSQSFRRQFAASYLAETDIEPRIDDEEREVLVRALDLLEGAKFEEAAAEIQKTRTPVKARNHARSDFMIGHLRFEQGRLPEAAAAYEVAVEKHPNYRSAWQGLGQTRFRQGDYIRCVPALTEVIRLGGGNGVTFGLLGVAYSNTGRYLSAESAFRMASILDPGTRDWNMGLVESLFKQERFAEVASLCESLLIEQPESKQLWLIQANAFVGMKQSVKAAENFELVDRLGGSTTENLNLLGDIYVNEELFALAASAYIRGMEIDPKADFKRGIRAAKILASRGSLEETRLIVDRVDAKFGNKLGMDDRKALLRLRARIALAEGGTEQQVAILEKIVKLDPLDGEALVLLGRHCGRNGAPEQAVFYFERAANLPQAEARAKLAHSEMLVRQKKYRAALPLLRRSLELSPRESVREFLEKVERAARNR